MFIVQLLLAIALQVVGYLLAPKAKKTKPEAAKDMDSPTADSGRPIPVVFGTETISGVNILWYGEKKSLEYQVAEGSGKK